MKLNEKLVQKLRESSIMIDLDRFNELEQRNKNKQKEFERENKYLQDQKKVQQQVQKKVNQCDQNEDSQGQYNFRVRPLSAAQQREYGMGQTQVGGFQDLQKSKQAQQNFRCSSSQKKFVQTVQDFSPQKQKQSQIFQDDQKLKVRQQVKRGGEEEDFIQNLDSEEENDFDLELDQFQQQQQQDDQGILDQISVELLEDYLSQRREDFVQIQKVALRVDTTNDSLQLLGELMQNLKSLKLNQSIVRSVRDLGTSLRGVQYLFLSRCQLQDLSGINAFPQLKELYVSFNSISDLSPLYFHECLEVLDLEGNEVEEDQNIEYLESMERLQSLNLKDNRLELSFEFRKRIKEGEMGKRLEYLNEQSVKEWEREGEKKIVQDQEKEKEEEQTREDEGDEKWLYGALIQMKMIDENDRDEWQKEMKSEPRTEEILLMSIKKKSSKIEKQKDSGASELNQGGDILYGNPLKALKNKKKNEQIENIPLMKYFEIYHQMENNQKKFQPKNLATEIPEFDNLFDKEENDKLRRSTTASFYNNKKNKPIDLNQFIRDKDNFESPTKMKNDFYQKQIQTNTKAKETNKNLFEEDEQFVFENTSNNSSSLTNSNNNSNNNNSNSNNSHQIQRVATAEPAQEREKIATGRLRHMVKPPNSATNFMNNSNNNNILSKRNSQLLSQENQIENSTANHINENLNNFSKGRNFILNQSSSKGNLNLGEVNIINQSNNNEKMFSNTGGTKIFSARKNFITNLKQEKQFVKSINETQNTNNNNNNPPSQLNINQKTLLLKAPLLPKKIFEGKIPGNTNSLHNNIFNKQNSVNNEDEIGNGNFDNNLNSINNSVSTASSFNQNNLKKIAPSSGIQIQIRKKPIQIKQMSENQSDNINIPTNLIEQTNSNNGKIAITDNNKKIISLRSFRPTKDLNSVNQN